MLIVLLPAPVPTSVAGVAVVLVPTTFKFLIVLLVAPSVPLLSTQMMAEDVPVFVLVTVMSRDGAKGDEPTALEPLIVMNSAPLRKMIALALEPPIEGDTPTAGLIVTVLVELEPPLTLIVSGKVSPVAVE